MTKDTGHPLIFILNKYNQKEIYKTLLYFLGSLEKYTWVTWASGNRLLDYPEYLGKKHIENLIPGTYNGVAFYLYINNEDHSHRNGRLCYDYFNDETSIFCSYKKNMCFYQVDLFYNAIERMAPQLIKGPRLQPICSLPLLEE